MGHRRRCRARRSQVDWGVSQCRACARSTRILLRALSGERARWAVGRKRRNRYKRATNGNGGGPRTLPVVPATASQDRRTEEPYASPADLAYLRALGFSPTPLGMQPAPVVFSWRGVVLSVWGGGNQSGMPLAFLPQEVPPGQEALPLGEDPAVPDPTPRWELLDDGRLEGQDPFPRQGQPLVYASGLPGGWLFRRRGTFAPPCLGDRQRLGPYGVLRVAGLGVIVGVWLGTRGGVDGSVGGRLLSEVGGPGSWPGSLLGVRLGEARLPGPTQPWWLNLVSANVSSWAATCTEAIQAARQRGLVLYPGGFAGGGDAIVGGWCEGKCRWGPGPAGCGAGSGGHRAYA